MISSRSLPAGPTAACGNSGIRQGTAFKQTPRITSDDPIDLNQPFTL
jgi:hypothetical protein